MSRIYKIVERADWDAALAAGRFEGAGIDLADGFIHFSTEGQARDTARLHFRGRADLVTLEVDADSLGEALRWEASRGGELFPHLYAPLDCKRVIAVRGAPVGADGIPDLGDLPA